MFEAVVSKFKRFWLWLNREPKDLDKAIKTHKHDALWRFSVGLLGLVCLAIVVLGAAPILQDAKLSGLYSNIEYLSLVSGFCCVMLLFSVLGLLFWFFLYRAKIKRCIIVCVNWKNSLRLKKLTEFDLVQLGVLGFAIWLGTTFGAELAKTLFNKFSGWVGKRGKTVKG